jgi:hypothetical protein
VTQLGSLLVPLTLVTSQPVCLIALGLVQLPSHTGLDGLLLSHVTRRRSLRPVTSRNTPGLSTRRPNGRIHGFGFRDLGIRRAGSTRLRDMRRTDIRFIRSAGLYRMRRLDLNRARHLGLHSTRGPRLSRIRIGDLGIRRIGASAPNLRRIGNRDLGIGDFGKRRAGLHICDFGRRRIRRFGLRRICGPGLRRRLANQGFPARRAGSPGDLPAPAWRPHVPNPSSDHRRWSDARLARVKTPYSA